MAATILNSLRAVKATFCVVRAFVRMRELAATHGDMAKRPDELEHNPPDPRKRPIGFVTPNDKGKRTSGARDKA